VIRSYRGRWPVIASSAYIDPAATIIGDVTIGDLSSVWPSVVIRGDVNYIRIGARTNVQDGSVLHVMKDAVSAGLGDNVTVGHGVILHGCTIESHVLIGMGSILLNNCKMAKARSSPPARSSPKAQSSRRQPIHGHPGKFRRA